jgi:hypothetical protein
MVLDEEDGLSRTVESDLEDGDGWGRVGSLHECGVRDTLGNLLVNRRLCSF